MPYIRLDSAVFERELAESRNRSADLIKSGAVRVNGAVITKNAFLVLESDVITAEKTRRYVGRAGGKLDFALEHFAVDVTGFTCADVGASTGGFTDCLLHNGAEKVYAVDVGTGQLHPKLRGDGRVVSLENTDIRGLELPEKVDLVCADVSFVSLTKVLGDCAALAKPGGMLIALIKPQFELGRRRFKNGIVKNPADHALAVRNVTDIVLSDTRLELIGTVPSVVQGAGGNQEFLMLIKKNRR